MQRGIGVAVEAVAGADVVGVVGPGLVDPVDRVEALALPPGAALHQPLLHGGGVCKLLVDLCGCAHGEHLHDGRPGVPHVGRVGACHGRGAEAAEQGLAGRVVDDAGPGGGSGHGRHGGDVADGVGVVDGPLQGLHAAHGGADHGHRLINAERVEHALLAAHHVADGEAGKGHAALAAGVGGRGGLAVADGVDGEDAVAGRVECAAGADHEVEAVVDAADGAERHHDRLAAVFQPAVHGEGDGEVFNRFARVERQTTQ